MLQFWQYIKQLKVFPSILRCHVKAPGLWNPKTYNKAQFHRFATYVFKAICTAFKVNFLTGCDNINSCDKGFIPFKMHDFTPVVWFHRYIFYLTLTLLLEGRGRMTWRGSCSGRNSMKLSWPPQPPPAQPQRLSGLLVLPPTSELCH